MAARLGGQLIDDDGAPTLDDPNNAKALDVLKQLTDAQGGYRQGEELHRLVRLLRRKNQFVKDQVGAEVDAAVVRQRADSLRQGCGDLRRRRSRTPAASRSLWPVAAPS